VKKIDALSMQKTAVTDKGIERLKGISVSHVDLSGCKGVTDGSLDCIAQLKDLKAVILTGTRVTEQGAAGLRKALPNCNIIR
jgi:internalin A